MAKFLIFTLALCLASVGGCSLVTISSNIPMVGGFTYEIVNLTDHYLTVAVDGQLTAVDIEGLDDLQPGLMPGQSGRISIRNWSDQSVEVTVTVKAYASHSSIVVDAISFRESVASHYKQSISRLIRKDACTNQLYSTSSGW